MTKSPEYQTVRDALHAVGAATHASEAHGLLCGMLSAPGDTEPARWLAQVLAGSHPRGDAARDCLTALTALFEASREDVHDSELRFQPLLPDDGAPLPERAAALGSWCEGYLAGLGLGGAKREAKLPREALEVLRDFGEIARVDTGLDADEDNEGAYAELVEYVRVGALLVLEHMAAPVRPSSPGARRDLH